MASPEVQLASQRIRRVQFSVNAIPVRLHSACLTGNVFGHGAATAGTSFGSLWRCSKTSAVASFSIWLRKPAGLVSPTRCAYQSQDDGLDTFDANTTLGFDDDERDYSIAACRLRMLYRTRIGAHQQSG